MTTKYRRYELTVRGERVQLGSAAKVLDWAYLHRLTIRFTELHTAGDGVEVVTFAALRE